MDSSFLEENLGLAYISCIEVDGKPILPPLMSEAKRAEMRNYKQLAIEKELRRQKEREQRLRSLEITPVSGSEAFKLGCTYTSTPLVTHLSTPIRSNSRRTPYFDDSTNQNKTAVQVLDTEEEPVALAKFESHFVIKHPYTSPGQILDAPDMKTVIRILPGNKDVPVDEDEGRDDSSSSDDGDKLLSAASSTGTYIIKADPNKSYEDERSEGEIVFEEVNSDDEVESIKGDDEDEKDGNILPKTKSESSVIRRKTATPPVNRRKRPAAYFDSSEEDDEPGLKDRSELSKISSNNTSLGKYLGSDVTWSSTLLTSRTDAESSAILGHVVPSEFDFRLSNQVPTSAEASPMSSKSEAVAENSEEDSDKENQDSQPGRHIRKLSYTLSSPSDLLIAATNQEHESAEANGNTDEDLVIPSRALSTIPSSNVTPSKPAPSESDTVPPTPSNQELDKRLENLNRHLAELQLGMGLNKKKHLERYLGDSVTKNENKPTVEYSDVQTRLQQLQESQERELAALAEKHRQQERQLKQDLEALKNISIVETKNSQTERISSENIKEAERTYYVPPPPTQKPLETEEHFDTSPSKLSVRSTVSSKQSYFSSRSTPTPVPPPERYYEQQLVSMTLTEGFSASTLSASTSVLNYGAQDSGLQVGLSKLQCKMKSMSPSMFKVGQDTRSPLLKGVVFQEPMDRPREVRRIPSAALDPFMKPKFDRVSAAVKGYLVRRLLNTEKIQNLIQTIRDTVDILLKLYDEAPQQDRKSAEFVVQSQEAELHRRLLQQLHGACGSFHDVFFKLSTKERMAIIATDRNKIRTKVIKASRKPVSPSKKPITIATLKAMERRFSVNVPQGPRRKTLAPDRDQLPLSVPSRYVPIPLGSQTVKAKPFRSYMVSPKRRRMTTYSKSLQQLSRPNPTSDNASDKSSRQTASATSSSSTASFKVKSRAGVVTKKEAPTRSRKLDATYTTSKLTSAYRPRQSSAR